MNPPPKPWESARANQRIAPVIPSGEGMFSAPGTVPIAQLCQRHARTAPPPLPPRPGRNVQGYGMGNYYGSSYPSYGGYSGYGAGYNSYGLGGYSGYGSYGGYGGYGINRMGFLRGNNPESRFITMAEEGSRPAFQSIESLVHAFGSVSFMLESTYNAMYSSFRAVLGVAENFGRLRELFGQFLSVFALFRWFRWLYKKGLYLLGLSAHDPGRETLWQQATQGVQDSPNGVNPNAKMTWPIMVFLGIVFSGPYLMWKLLGSMNIPETDTLNRKDWTRKESVVNAVALYDFAAASEQELNMSAGQKIFIAPKNCQPNIPGWLLASNDGKKIGYVPANYIKVVGRPGAKKPNATSNVQHISSTPAALSSECSDPEMGETLPKTEGSELYARLPVNEEIIPAATSPTLQNSHIPGPSGDGPGTGSSDIQVHGPRTGSTDIQVDGRGTGSPDIQVDGPEENSPDPAV